MNVTQPECLRTTDDELAKTVAARDENSQAAFFGLYEKHKKLTLVFIRSRVPTNCVDDLHQDIWLKAWQKAETFAGGNFRSWLLTIASHRIVDFYRSRARNNEQSGSESQMDSADTTETPIELLIDQETSTIFSHCLEQLDEQSSCIVLRRIHGESYREICKSIKISENAAHKLMFNAKLQLKECVEAKTR